VTIIAFDPSSSVTGYAVMTDARTVTDCGKLTPGRARDDANTRIRVMVAEAVLLIRQVRPDWVVIEDTSGKVSGRHRGSGAGLAIYGKAVGWFLAELERVVPGKVVAVLENDWTRGTKKGTRQRIVAAEYRGAYDPAQDPGGDVSDAIGIGRWWFVEGRLRAA
jgi:hypothetical protein